MSTRILFRLGQFAVVATLLAAAGWTISSALAGRFNNNNRAVGGVMVDADGEIDPTKRDVCADVEEHVVQTILGGLSNYGG